MGKYLSNAGIPVAGYYSKTVKSAEEAAAFTNTTAYQDLKELIAASNTLFITTPDGVVEAVWDCIADSDMDLSGYIICHFSGSLSSYVFSGIEQIGASGCSVHPMYAFSDKYTSYLQFHTAYLTAEGGEQAVLKMRALFEGLGHHVLTLKSEDKAKYHAAAVLASNAVVGLFQSSLDILKECGFSEADSTALLAPLIQGNVTSMLQSGCVHALTGPVERSDTETVNKHLQALRGSKEGEIYCSLSRKLVALAKCKNPQRDYSALERIIDEKYSTYL